jgi:hypothetical protein
MFLTELLDGIARQAAGHDDAGHGADSRGWRPGMG